MQYTPEQLQKLHCYIIHFWGKEDFIKVTPRQAAGIKLAIKNDLKFFEIDRDLYMVKDIKRIEYDWSYEVWEQKQSTDLLDGATWEMLDTNYYLKDQKLLS